jgi:branched-subunit amino acid aminotransferase/4-amino-4-deoxychorismate lyase
VILEICRSLQLKTREANLFPRELKNADGVFLSLSSFGVVEAVSLDEHPLKQSALAEKLRRAYIELLCAETARVV